MRLVSSTKIYKSPLPFQLLHPPHPSLRYFTLLQFHDSTSLVAKMQTPTHVAIAGATGTLGPPILEALLAASHTVTVLTRVGSTAAGKLRPHPNMSVREVDMADTGSITPALEGVSVVVSNPPGAKCACGSSRRETLSSPAQDTDGQRSTPYCATRR